MEWIRRPSKIHHVASIIWKAMALSFDVIGDGLAWKVGKGNKVRVGRDPWPGSLGSHLLPDNLVLSLQQQVIFYLSQVGDPVNTSIWAQEWKSHHELGLDDGFEASWASYTRALKLAHIRLKDQEDELVWVADPFGIYTPKVGYIHLNMDLQLREPRMVVEGVVEVKFPSQIKTLPMVPLSQKSSNLGINEKMQNCWTRVVRSLHDR
jgi:hypothetical protein